MDIGRKCLVVGFHYRSATTRAFQEGELVSRNCEVFIEVQILRCVSVPLKP
jgi:hypothetical protein